MEYEAPVPQPETDQKSGSPEVPGDPTQYGSEPGPEQHPPPRDPCACGGDCDPGSIDELTCRATRLQTQADIVKASLEKITQYRDEFATARTRYQAALDAANTEVKATRTLLDAIIQEKLCRVKGHRRECLHKGLAKAVECIRNCGDEAGCCAKPCDHFDDKPGQADAGELKGRIERYRRDVEAASACFTDLMKQITELPERVAKLKALVEALKQDVDASTTGKDWARLYARAIVARWELEDRQVYAGFPKAEALVDCLCQALTCIMKGWEAIAVLEGAVAELDCNEKQRKERCRKRRDDMVGLVICHYDECCEDAPAEPNPEAPDEDEEHPPKDPCGCEGHHHDGEQTQTAV